MKEVIPDNEAGEENEGGDVGVVSLRSSNPNLSFLKDWYQKLVSKFFYFH